MDRQKFHLNKAIVQEYVYNGLFLYVISLHFLEDECNQSNYVHKTDICET